MPGGASGASLNFWEPRGVQKTLLGSNVCDFLHFSWFFIVFVWFGCLGELLGASLSFWEPPEVQKNLLGSNVKGSGISNFCNFLHFSWFLLFLFRLGVWGSFWGPP